jgi:hypothetical protein
LFHPGLRGRQGPLVRRLSNGCSGFLLRLVLGAEDEPRDDNPDDKANGGGDCERSQSLLVQP